MTKLSNKKIKEERQADSTKEKVPEIGGFADKNLPEPTRYGDWDVGGRCSDF
ncbi:MAG: DUF1674 domain-containing protein [Rhodospirillales bacterium]|nr:DUF1674 domain-containing protein [Alphaproteobacteria bacterium]MCB1839701.1 DUF1674 domain-containing protein [Alphaproteobacteria bacterium]MCB9977484.1 DUF1674 domain-containing protein [Rhodospirillales bacterium]